MVLDVILPTSGSYEWFGKAPSKENRKKVGAILEGPLFYPYLTGANNLKVVADIKGVSHSEIDRVLDRVGLLDRRDSPFKTYSLGMKQRLAVAAALLNSPRVLILDEPTNGLDPQGIAEIRQLIREIGQQGMTILLASHMLDEVEKVCSHVAVLRTGELLYSGRVEGLSSTGSIVEMAASNLNEIRNSIAGFAEVKEIKESEGILLVTFSEDPDPAALNRHMFENGVDLSRLAIRKSTLEEQFLEIIRESK